MVIDVDDTAGPGGERLWMEYEDFIAGGDPEFDWQLPEDEWDDFLNYTSGTTGTQRVSFTIIGAPIY